MSPPRKGHGSGEGGSGGKREFVRAHTVAEDLVPGERPEFIESTVISRENATHLAFAKSRKEDFVYAPTTQYLRVLNDYCSPEGSIASSLPLSSILVVVGASGHGKSSLLAHWAEMRRRSKTTSHEFIYEHYAGCSYDSVKLSLFLFRLMNQLKVTFGLRDFELPREHEEEKLKFSFGRCLEAAVGRTNARVDATFKRKSIILILDGIDSIRTEDGGDSLSWLPNSFPSGVRVIVSATHVSTPMHDSHQCRSVTRKAFAFDADADIIYDTSLAPSAHDSHTIRELRRRNATFLVAEPLDEAACRAILDLYESSRPQHRLDASEKDMIVDAACSANPLVVRLVLHGLALFDSDAPLTHGYTRHSWLQCAIQASDVPAVYTHLIRRWNDILLNELQKNLAIRQAAAKGSGFEGTQPRILSRSGSKRDLGGLGGGAPSSAGHGMLARMSSMRQVPAEALSAADAAEVEKLQEQIEQRALLVRHTLSLFAVARYGLSESDIIRLLGDTVPLQACQQVLAFLEPHLMRIRRDDCSTAAGTSVVLYDLSHNQLRLVVRYGYLRDDQLRSCYYKELATYFDGLEASQRRIDELPVQLERCAMWSALQAALVNVKMFQLWWSERNRQEFFSYWMVLRSNCSIHDPVEDFIRSLDEYIAHENPSAEQLLVLFLTITDFLRSWQHIDTSKGLQLVLHRPEPPQLQEFITSLGSFTTAHLPEDEAKRVLGEIDALCIHKTDGYFVRRWLWTQFPLIGIAFESRFLRNLLATKGPSGSSAAATNGTTSGGGDDNESVSASSPALSPTSSTSGNSFLPPATSNSTKTTGSGSRALSSILPKSLLGRDSKTKPPSFSPINKRATAVPTTTGGGGFDAIPEDDFGAFEFLAADPSDLSGPGSISKLESHLMELRARYDKLKYIAKDKQDALQKVDSRLLDVRAQGKEAGQSASQIDELLDQIRQINDETMLGRQRGEYYRAILRHCEIHPARDPNTIEIAETTVTKLKQEVVQQQQKAQVIAYENRLATAEVKKLQLVIDDKARMHQTALDRLRWRHELMHRLHVNTLKKHGLNESTSSETTSARDDDDEDYSDEEEGQNDPQTTEESESPGKMTTRATSRRRPTTNNNTPGDPQFSRAKDRLLQKRETTIERIRKAELLKLYVGSPYKDDGVLGALRQVGINKPEEAHVYWQDQQEHANQLEAEERSAEQRVAEYREKLEHLHTVLLNLKLSGSEEPGADGSGNSKASAADENNNGAAASPPSSSASGGATAGESSSKAHNIKLLDHQLGAATTVTQQKKERTTRLKALTEKLHLGLVHVGHILGVNVSQQTESTELAETVEQVVRLYLGDEGHMQSTSSNGLRRKNSVRAASQSGLHALAPPDARSPDEKMRYNLRVFHSPQRQLNPYTGFNETQEEDDDGEEEDEEEEQEEKPVGKTGRGGHGRERGENNSDEVVTKRGDIKKRAQMELERKRNQEKRAEAKKKSKGE
ncbi:hypothetical protein Poli38472_003378 [Pythium oligandrum]|uniref:NACHT domain-containing protein n=1 Tax=Pythium oligandrum TaxID=41045 RepID=A0A8K1C6R2_PYTOL|nr:hypothetical protein Poli38472_003378 [Pythium oligandrum]|eukprot:TMW57453.1 hypothetical protein Poli38472_003378 [Pythium oligandrum]